MESLEKIVWLASYPKSGNTWLRVFLNSILNIEKGDFSINTMSITDGIVSNRALFEKWIGVDSEELMKSEVDYYYPQVLMKRAETLTERSFIKTHTANIKNESGLFIFPNEVTEKVIYIVRNPLDVCVSMAFHSGHVDFDQSIKTLNDPSSTLADSNVQYNVQIHQYLGDWSSHYKSWVNSFTAEKILVVRYEDMNLNSEETFGRVLEFLNISVKHDTLVQTIEKCSFDNLKKQEQIDGFKERPSKSESFFRKGKVGAWREFLNQEQEDNIVNAHCHVMNELYYIDCNKKLLI